MQNLKIRKATLSDLDFIVKVRIEVLRAANHLSNDVDMSNVEHESYHFYRKYLKTENHVTYLAYIDENLAGCGSICFYSLMPTYHNPSDKNAYIMNMYTRPDYRRQGIASAVLELLVKEAKTRKIRKITLEASPMGRQLYEKYGFVPMQSEMILPE